MFKPLVRNVFVIANALIANFDVKFNHLLSLICFNQSQRLVCFCEINLIAYTSICIEDDLS